MPVRWCSQDGVYFDRVRFALGAGECGFDDVAAMEQPSADTGSAEGLDGTMGVDSVLAASGLLQLPMRPGTFPYVDGVWSPAEHGGTTTCPVARQHERENQLGYLQLSGSAYIQVKDPGGILDRTFGRGTLSIVFRVGHDGLGDGLDDFPNSFAAVGL